MEKRKTIMRTFRPPIGLAQWDHQPSGLCVFMSGRVVGDWLT